MRQMNKYGAWSKVAIVVAALLQASCSMMKEDLSDCPDCRNLLRITLRYDYNTQRANMFSDHVEEVTVFVVDAATGTVVDTLTACNTAAYQSLRDPSFGFNIEGLTPGKYRLYATGRSAAEAGFNVSVPDVGQPMSQLQFAVPTDANCDVPALRLDTLWNTLKPASVDVSGSEPVEAVIPLMRLTNDLNVMVFRRDHPTDNGHERYEVLVTDNHPTLGYDNAPAPALQSVVYHPFASWTTATAVSDSSTVGTIAERNAHYDFTLSRLIQHDDARQNPRLIIRNKETGHEIVNIDLCYYLSLARNAYEIQNYGIQEYLDREYDYRLDFGIEGTGEQETWKYVTIRINVLGWAIRIQNETL
ncbi:MAG: FimB/Mfa2 family fimbrial subunit [Bacteroidaceae bacterium]|nr:FimB/Mfa2 family fimbrial subunit [Bacteroidaceae bacterium]